MEEAVATRDAEIAARVAELGAHAVRIAELEGVASHLSETVVEREREVGELRVELSEVRRRQEEDLRALAAISRQVEEIRSQARGQATRIRMQALREVLEQESRSGDGNGQLIDAAGGERGGGEEALPVGNGHAEREAAELFEGVVHLDVGPISDFAQLARFEDAASEIGAASGISIQRFSRGRATLAVNLRHPVELLRELEERCDLEFKVRKRGGDHLIIDVDE